MKTIISYIDFYYHLKNYIRGINSLIDEYKLDNVIQNEILSNLFKLILENPNNEINVDYFNTAIESMNTLINNRNDSYGVVGNLFDDLVYLIESNVPDYNSYFQNYSINFSIVCNNKIVIVEINNVTNIGYVTNT